MVVTVVDAEALAALPGEHRHLRSGVEQVRAETRCIIKRHINVLPGQIRLRVRL